MHLAKEMVDVKTICLIRKNLFFFHLSALANLFFVDVTHENSFLLFAAVIVFACICGIEF